MKCEILAEIIRENRIRLITDMVEEHIYKSNLRCLICDAKNGFPVGYAKTFKIISIKKRINKNEKIYS